MLIIPSIRIDIDTVRNSETLALGNIATELIVNTAAKRRSTKPNPQNSEIDARSFNCIPVNSSLMLADIDALRRSSIRKNVHRQ